ncbi:hypothetical protein JCM16814_30330 [Desulfobaculum senezii]
MRDIRKLVEKGVSNFAESFYINAQNNLLPIILSPVNTLTLQAALLNPLTLCAPLTRMKTDDQITSHNMRGNPMTTSLKVAEVFGKEHKNVIQSIEQLDCSEEFRKLNFQLSSYSVPNNRRPYPMYLMTRDGFTFLAMGFTIPVFPFLLPLNPANQSR